MHPVFVGLQFFERPRSALPIGRTRFRSPCIIMIRPRRFNLSIGSYLRIARSQYRNAAPSMWGLGSTKNGKLYDAVALIMSITRYFNVTLQVARLYGWLEGPLIVSQQLVALGTASSLEKYYFDAQ